MVQAGRTDAIIDLLKPASTHNAVGEAVQTYSTFISRPIWAEVNPQILGANETYKQDQSVSVSNTNFKLRFTTETTIVPDMRVRYKSKDYNIESVININDEDREWLLICNKVAT